MTFVFEIANFVALAAVLAWLFFKPVRQAIEDQRAKTKGQEEEASRVLAEAECLRQKIETQEQALSAELRKMQTKARDAAKQKADQIIAEARAQITRERTALKRESLQIQQAQTSRIASAVMAVTHATLERFLHQMDGPELEFTLISAACRELQTIPNDSLAPVTIESATKIDDGLLATINASLGNAAKTADYRVVPELKGGVRISTAHGLIDASIAGLANFAEQSLSTEIDSMIQEESAGE